jgi:hypothetical protein
MRALQSLRRFLFVIVTMLLFCSNSSFAIDWKTTGEARADAVQKLCRTSISKVIGRMRPSLDGYKDLRKGDDLFAVLPYLSYAASADQTQGRVLVSVGMCNEVYLNLPAIMLVKAYPESVDKLVSYSDYLAQTIEFAIKGRNPTWMKIDLLPFTLWAKLDLSRLTPMSMSMMEESIEHYMPDAFAHVLGHEVAHLIYKDKPYTTISKSDSQFQEARADKLGVKLALQAATDVQNPFSLQPLFGVWKREAMSESGPAQYHPNINCRISFASLQLWNAQQLLSQSDLSPDTKAYWLKLKTSAEEKVGRTIDDVDEIYREVLKIPMCAMYK